MMLLSKPFSVTDTTDQLRSFVQASTSNILAILTIMRSDDGVEWNSDYGASLVKVELDAMELYKRSRKDLDETERCQLFVDHNSFLTKRNQTLHEMECYAQTM